MNAEGLPALRGLEGRRVCVALSDGSRIDDCVLVSGGRPGVETVWVFTNRSDVFFDHSHIIDVWEAA